jgi:DnaK suppressor protein
MLVSFEKKKEKVKRLPSEEGKRTMTIDLENMKVRLENKRAELQASIDELRKEATSSITALALEREVQESEDVAADLSGRERERSVFATELMLLMEVQHALKGIAEGTYGRCTACGQPIAEKRLEALPWEDLCIKDQKQLEQRQYSYVS